MVIVEGARALLDRMAQRVAKHYLRRCRRAPEELHKLRKELKKLSFSAGYLASFYPPKPVKRFQELSRHLLVLLGKLNDAAMATGLAKGLCADGRSELAPAVAALARWGDRRRDKALSTLPKAWAKFAAASPFWR